jgi:hypothetical protein
MRGIGRVKPQVTKAPDDNNKIVFNNGIAKGQLASMKGHKEVIRLLSEHVRGGTRT